MARGISQTVCNQSKEFYHFFSAKNPLFHEKCEMVVKCFPVWKASPKKRTLASIKTPTFKKNFLQSKWPTSNLVKRNQLFPGSKIDKGVEPPKVNTL